MMLKKYFDNLLELPSLCLFLFKCYNRQKQFMEKTILLDLVVCRLMELVSSKVNDNQRINQKDIRKISFYYGLAVPVIGEIYSTLRGTKISRSERKTLTYLGGLTGLFDDFFDEKNTPESHIKELVNNPKKELAGNSHEDLFIQFYIKALEQENSKIIKKYLNDGFDAQIQSKKQKNASLSSEEILHITKQKGGIFMLFYRAALDDEITTMEKELLFKIGLVGQLENDIFDIYKDYENDIRTLATTTESIVDLRSLYKSILNDVYEFIQQMDFPERNKKKFSKLVAIVASRGLVCLNQLSRLEKDNKFEISKYSRKQLTCDMGKLKNRIKWLGFWLSWNIDTKK